jgi:hypothetical protein
MGYSITDAGDSSRKGSPFSANMGLNHAAWHKIGFIPEFNLVVIFIKGKNSREHHNTMSAYKTVQLMARHFLWREYCKKGHKHSLEGIINFRIGSRFFQHVE